MMHRTVLLGIGLLLSFFAWSRTIKGTVLDADDGESLPSFHVVLLGEKVIETYTDVDGNFTLYVPHDKPVHVRFQSLGFVSFDVVDIPNVKQIDLGKVYIPLNSYLNTLVYNTTDSIITQKI
ncbi:MAG: carboxypeptidase-like regulatory domain-containing protein, partial [Cytophagales bacterium]|nr:carboxypeptidase-like regulatory domain-containing protein [Cytophagales bacterium]